jgi:hypothetical protein
MIEKRFTARVLEKVEHSPGTWDSLRIGVFDGEKQIGEYVRNYHAFGETTFYAFEQYGKWFALYSKDYTCTRLMSLPDCQDIGGEQSDAWGFCPVEFYVPEITVQKFERGENDPPPYNPRHDPKRWAKIKHIRATWWKLWQRKCYTIYDWPDKKTEFKEACKKHDKLFREWLDRHPFEDRYAKWGLVAGCIFGDDTSWKVEFIDLSRAAEGIIKRDDRFGYLSLPGGVSLRDAVNVDFIDADDDEKQMIQIAHPLTFTISGRLHTNLEKEIGKKHEPNW